MIVYITSTANFTFANPSGTAATGQKLKATFRNQTGGSVGTVTYGANYKHATITFPATGNNLSITWEYDGTNWVEESRSSATVPN